MAPDALDTGHNTATDVLVAATIDAIDPALASDTARAGLRSLAASMPPTSGLGFECRLGADGGHLVDLCIRLAPYDGSTARAAGQGGPMAALCRAWCAQNASPFETLWLEYDAGSGSRPGLVFLSLATGPAPARALDMLADDPVLGGVLAMAAAPWPQAAAVIDRRIAPHGRLRHIGVPLARAGGAIRICHHVTAAALGSYLNDAGLAGRAAAIAAVLQPIVPSASTLCLHLDVGLAVGPRIGVEVVGGDADGWRRLFAGLQAAGLCSEAQGRAADQWSSVPERLRDNPAGFSCRLPTHPEAFAQPLVLRALNHVKLVFTPEGGATAKLYLYAGLVWPDHRP